ncbi:MAG: 50S ribosomal protein L29 [Bacteroidetes bacterium ADurb.Bin302]|jgi:large subunit ribosomal protein L29|nr:MAG: 50S ribosomal protein L29 [Bacteroidetes bacterium ADurb.Bin302]
MKNSEIKELTDKEILEKIETEKGALSKLKLSHTISPLDNPNQIREARKTVARLKTELTKREMNKQK